MLRITIYNNGHGTDEIGHYDYYVDVNGTAIESGSVEHERAKDWIDLAEKVVEDAKKEREASI